MNLTNLDPLSPPTPRATQTLITTPPPLMPQIDAAIDPAPVTSNMHLPDQQGELVPPGRLLIGQWPTVTTTSGQQANTLSALQALLSETLSQLRSCSTPQSASQEIPAGMNALSMAPQTPNTLDTEHNLFDPSKLVERKFFSGSSKEICSYLSKYFINGLEPEQRLEMVKRYKRPDIPSMRVQKLDNLFQRPDLYAARNRDDNVPSYSQSAHYKGYWGNSQQVSQPSRHKS